MPTRDSPEDGSSCHRGSVLTRDVKTGKEGALGHLRAFAGSSPHRFFSLIFTLMYLFIQQHLLSGYSMPGTGLVLGLPFFRVFLNFYFFREAFPCQPLSKRALLDSLLSTVFVFITYNCVIFLLFCLLARSPSAPWTAGTRT